MSLYDIPTYPTRGFSQAFERRQQEVELKLQNMHRVGTVTEIKFDKEKKRWFAKMADGDGDKAYKSDWLPWNTFSNGAIKMSIPPRVGQSVQIQAPNGNSEIAVMSAYHNNPDNPSPSDKEDQVVIRVEKPDKDGKPGTDKNKILNLTLTEDGSTTEIGDSTQTTTKDTISHKTKNNTVETENDTTKAKSHSLDTDSRTVNAKSTVIKSASYQLGGKVLINC